MLPTRDNVMALANAVQSFQDVGPGITKLALWAKQALDNEGKQYVVESHLEEKHRAVEPNTRSASLLRRFLSQREPPQREVTEEWAQEADLAVTDIDVANLANYEDDIDS